jgi:hypothetical protein
MLATARAALAVGLVAGCAWSALEGGYGLAAGGTGAVIVGLEALASALESRLRLCLAAAALGGVCSILLGAALRAWGRPPDDARRGAHCVGAAVALSWLALQLLSGRAAAESAEGLLLRVLTVQLVLLLGIGAWLALRRWPGALRLPVPGTRAIALCVVYALLVEGAFHGANGRARAAPGPASLAQRVVLIGVDGAGWDVMDPLLARGQLPNVARLLERGVRAPLETLEPTLSPVIWTTIATGMPMEVHGIRDFVVREDGAERLVTSDLRRVPALWNILSQQGRSVGVVGWMVTWPAEPVEGFLVSSYTGLGRTWKGRLVRGIPDQTWPRDLYPRLEARMADVEQQLGAAFRRIFPRLDPGRLSETQRRVVADTRDVLLGDMIQADIGTALLRERAPDFFTLYLGGVDVVGHRFWKYREPDALPYRVRAEDVAMLGDVVPNYYRFVDGIIGRVVEAAGPEALVLLVSDHGMEPFQAPGVDDDQTSGHHEQAPPGVLVVSGPGTVRGRLAGSASVFDVAPTVLHALGLPLARDMRGHPLLAAFAPAHRGRPVYVASYRDAAAPPPAAEPRETEIDGLLRERLESLGYLR